MVLLVRVEREILGKRGEKKKKKKQKVIEAAGKLRTLFLSY